MNLIAIGALPQWEFLQAGVNLPAILLIPFIFGLPVFITLFGIGILILFSFSLFNPRQCPNG
ncbi:MAG TPA: hypothetical protein EYQ80_05365 [Candidatus Poseidoniales archaeon]|nr:hypothetical protein [Candidatus Poseidoniales archaeon]